MLCGMRSVTIAALLICFCLSEVQGTEPQFGMPPALLEAIAGQEPYASLVEYGLPLLNSSEEVAALPVEQQRSRATAIKRVLLVQMTRARAERHRISSENFLASARMALENGAPHVFAVYQQLEGEGRLRARERYVVREALKRLYEDFRVDALALRYFAELSRLSEEEVQSVIEWLPMEALFNLVPASEMTQERLVADILSLEPLVNELVALYAGINSSEQAAAALEHLLPLVVRYVQLTVGQHEWNQVQLPEGCWPRINEALLQLRQQRSRLRELNYYDSRRLYIADFFLD